MPAVPIYLDHNATAPILPEVADAVREAALRYPGNPASQHEFGRQARRALEQARQRIGELLGARTTGMDADQVIFTSGGTESNNLALAGLLPPNEAERTKNLPVSSPRRGGLGRGEGSAYQASAPLPGPLLQGEGAREGGETTARLIISAIEHPSIARAAAAFGPQILAVDSVGVIRLDQLESLLTPATQLASIMLASNETGVIQPIPAAADLCRRHGVLIHTDATQAVGKLLVDFQGLGVDALTAAAHKFHGPLGIGVLLLRHGVTLTPVFQGGFQQASLRPGTESVALAIGMQRALELWHAEAEERRQRMTDLRDRLEAALQAGYPDAVVVGNMSPRLPHTSNVSFVGLNRQALVMAFDLAGVACSSGSACASGSSEPSPTLLAMSLPDEVISSSVRFSVGATTTPAEIDETARRIVNVCNNLRR